MVVALVRYCWGVFDREGYTWFSRREGRVRGSGGDRGRYRLGLEEMSLRVSGENRCRVSSVDVTAERTLCKGCRESGYGVTIEVIARVRWFCGA